MHSNFRSLNDILEKDSAFSRFKKSVKEQDVVEEFHNIFPDLEKTVKVTNINKGILYLAVENSVLRNELYLRKTLVLEKINKYFTHQVITDIKFTNFRNINRNKK